jgi:aminopeptidase N
VAPGGRATLKVAYGGALTGFVDAGNLYVKDRIDRDFTILREDALAFPVVGVPSGEANRAHAREDFQFRARVTVPDGEVVAAGGRLVDRRSANGRTTFEFAGAGVPFLNVAVARYLLVESGGVSVYALPEDGPTAERLADATRRALARLESRYGPLRDSPRVTIIEIPEGFGSQAGLNAGIILEAGAFRDPARTPELYHELTHFWNPADLDTPSPRWNEGLAMYLQYRLARDLDSFAGTDAAVERARTRLCDAPVAALLRRTPFVEYGRADLSDYSYRVGLLMFSALDALVGPEKLDAGLRAHIQGHLSGGGTTAQMVGSLSEAAAPAGLDASAFFRDWMFTTGWVDRVCSASAFPEAVATWRPRGQPGR